MTFDEGGGAPGSLDFYDLTQGSQITKVYEVPGTMLIISAAPLEAFPTYVGVYIWGYRFPGE